MNKQLLLIGAAITCSSCVSPPAQEEKKMETHLSTDTVNLDFTVTEAAELIALFDRTSGWFGADCIFALPLSGVDQAGGSDSTMLIFSDNMVGEIKDGQLGEWTMVNNTVAYLKGSEPDESKISFHWKKGMNEKPETFFVPATPSAEKGDYYWLGDGFVNTEKDHATYIFAYRMRNLSSDAWSFSEMGNVLIKLPPGSRPPFSDQQQIETPLSFQDPENKRSEERRVGKEFVRTCRSRWAR